MSVGSYRGRRNGASYRDIVGAVGTILNSAQVGRRIYQQYRNQRERDSLISSARKTLKDAKSGGGNGGNGNGNGSMYSAKSLSGGKKFTFKSKKKNWKYNKKGKKRPYMVSQKNVIRISATGTISSGASAAKLDHFSSIMAGSIMDGYGDNVYRFNYDDVGSAMERIAPDMRSMNGARVKLCAGSYAKTTFRNNSSVDCTLKLWDLTAKYYHNSTPTNSVQQGIDDILSSGAYSSTSPVLVPEDSHVFRKDWKVVKKVTHVMRPGDTVSFYQKLVPHVHRFDTFDVHNSAYRKNIGKALMIQLRGTIAHDSTNTTTEVGYSAAQVDYVLDECHIIQGIVEKNFFAPSLQVTDGTDTFTNAANVYDKDNPQTETFDT